MAITTAKKVKLNKMNRVAADVGLGDLLAKNVIAAGLFTTVGGDATESITVSGCAVGDCVIVTMNTTGASPVTVTKAVAASGSITVTLSGNPSTDHVLNYMVIRAV